MKVSENEKIYEKIFREIFMSCDFLGWIFGEKIGTKFGLIFYAMNVGVFG